MKGNGLKFGLDVAAAVSMLAMICTGYILRFALPPGTNRSLILWGMGRHEWGSIHSWCSAVLLVVIAVHVIVHWKWVVAVVSKRLFGMNTNNQNTFRSGITLGIILLLSFALFAWKVQQSVEPGPAPEMHKRSGLMHMNAATTAVTDQEMSKPVDFWNEIYPLFETNCIRCHGPRKQAAGFRADSREHFFQKDKPLIVPGSSSKSPLMDIVSGTWEGIESVEVHVLLPEETELIRKWIDEGARWPD